VPGMKCITCYGLSNDERRRRRRRRRSGSAYRPVQRLVQVGPLLAFLFPPMPATCWRARDRGFRY